MLYKYYSLTSLCRCLWVCPWELIQILYQHRPPGNRPFPSSLVPLFQNESKCETFHMKMSSACSFIFMQISHFHKNGFALRLALKQRHKGTQTWPSGCSFFVGQRLRGWVVSKRLENKSAWSSSYSWVLKNPSSCLQLYNKFQRLLGQKSFQNRTK